MELVVADSARNDVDLFQREQRDNRSLVDDVAVDASPEQVREIRVAALELERTLDLGFDATVAEFGPVRRRTTGEEGAEVVGCRGIVGQPREEPLLGRGGVD